MSVFSWLPPDVVLAIEFESKSNSHILELDDVGVSTIFVLALPFSQSRVPFDDTNVFEAMSEVELTQLASHDHNAHIINSDSSILTPKKPKNQKKKRKKRK